VLCSYGHNIRKILAHLIAFIGDVSRCPAPAFGFGFCCASLKSQPEILVQPSSADQTGSRATRLRGLKTAPGWHQGCGIHSMLKPKGLIGAQNSTNV
jgi:hypothetical protein